MKTIKVTQSATATYEIEVSEELYDRLLHGECYDVDYHLDRIPKDARIKAKLVRHIANKNGKTLYEY